MITRRRVIVVIAAASCALTVAGVAAAVTGWNVGLNSGSSANAQGNGFAPPSGSTSSPANASLTINWTAGAGATPDHYTITRNGAAVPAASGCTGNQTGASCIDSGLQPNTTYTYVVTAVLGNWTTSSTSFAGTTTGAAFGATDLGHTSTCTSSLNNSNHTCGGPLVTTTSGSKELILVNLTGSSSSSTTISNVSGPFSDTPALITGGSKEYAVSTSKNYVFAFVATGNGNATAQQVSVTFDNGTTLGTGFIDIVELGQGNSIVKAATGAGNNTGGSSSVTVSNITPTSAADGEVVWLGTSGNATFAPPSGKGWTAVASTATNSGGVGSFSNAAAQAQDQTWTESNSNKDWGYVAIEVKAH